MKRCATFYDNANQFSDAVYSSHGIFLRSWGGTVIHSNVIRPRGGGGGHFHTWEYWGCAAGQGAFLSFQLWHRVSFLSFRNWDRVLFWASNSGHPLSMYFADFWGHYQPNSITFFTLIASKCYKQIFKSLKRPWNMKYIGSNYTISRSIKFGVNFQIGTGCLLAARRIGTGSGFEHAGGTPLPIFKASTTPGIRPSSYNIWVGKGTHIGQDMAGQDTVGQDKKDKERAAQDWT